MAIKISKPIVGYQVVTEETEAEEKAKVKAAVQIEPQLDIEHMHENVDRPEFLQGSTYKIKTPLSDHALYITINDIVLNPGTDHEQRRPFEIFINSKNMEHFQWVLALTRVISAVFRKGGDATFLVEELKAVFDPQGGYFKKGGKFMPSLVAEIGCAIESHMKMIGMIHDEEMSAHQQQILNEKRAEFEGKSAANNGAAKTEAAAESDAGYPEGAQLCNKCHTKAMILMDGCMTCLSCGNSKCG